MVGCLKSQYNTEVQCCVAVVESGCGAYDVLVTFLLSGKQLLEGQLSLLHFDPF